MHCSRDELCRVSEEPWLDKSCSFSNPGDGTSITVKAQLALSRCFEMSMWYIKNAFSRRGRGIVECVVIRLRAGRSRIRTCTEERDIYLFQKFQTISGGHPAWYSMGTWVSYCWQSGPGREISHSRQTTAEIKNVWSCTSTFPVCLYAVDSKSLSLHSRVN